LPGLIGLMNAEHVSRKDRRAANQPLPRFALPKAKITALSKLLDSHCRGADLVARHVEVQSRTRKTAVSAPNYEHLT
jgi:hypothetical protein